MTDPRPSASRTAAATAASVAKRRRGRQERLAAELSAEGWHTTPPERVEEVRAALAAAGVSL